MDKFGKTGDSQFLDYKNTFSFGRERGSHILRSDRETRDIVQDWLKILVADIFNEDIQQLVP
jgi:hypothetical protein